MSITFPTLDKNARGDASTALVDVGTTNAQGTLRLLDALDNTLANLPMSNPAFGASADGVSTANAITNGTGLLVGAATKYKMLDRDLNEVWEGTVGAVGSGADLESTTSSTNITISEIVSVSSLTYVEVS